jgi:hypothetical protein
MHAPAVLASVASRCRFPLTRLLAPAALALCAVACAEAPPPMIRERAPAAARPGLLGAYHSTKRPSKQSGALAAGEVAELKACPFDPRVAELPAGGGLLLRLESPVPLDLRLQLDTSQGARVIGTPEDLDDEEQLVRRGFGYFYENVEITRGVPAGKVTPRELAIWPGAAAAADRRVDLSARTVSFDPRATGDERESAPLLLSLVGKCPDVALSISKESIQLLQGASRRLFVGVKPLGDGVRTMKSTLTIAGMPPGLTAQLNPPEVTSADWTSGRDATLDLTAAPETLPNITGAPVKLTLKVTVGNLERKLNLDVVIKPKPE